MTRKLAYLSGAPRVSTKPIAEATGARQHVLGTMLGFKANGWQIAPYIVGDKVPESWIKPGQQKSMAKSFLKRLAADGMRMLLSAKHARRALKDISAPDWVYERYGALQLFGYFFQRRGTPWILETNNPFFHESSSSDRKSVALPFLVRWAEKFAYQKCDILVVISADLKRIISEQLGIPADKIVVLPNAADTETFNPDTTTAIRPFPADTFVIGFQGNMYKWAGCEMLVRAIAALRKEGLNVATVLLGDGQERQNLEALVQELGIADYVKFPGRVPREQVPSYIAGYDLCYSGQINLSTNSMYHSPLKLYDYMAMGKPVIASAFDDAKKLTQNGQLGYLFTPESLESLIATAKQAYAERDKLPTMGAAARADIVANHSWNGRIRDFIATAESILAKLPPRKVKAAGYSPFERMVAKVLEKTPWLRKLVRDGYYAFSYLRKRDKGFTAKVNGGTLQSAAEWAGVSPHNGPTFFGYYDKSPFSTDNRYLLQHEGVAEGQPLNVAAYDRVEHKRVPLGSTPAWMWQQGAQATWLTGLGPHVAGFNTTEGDKLGMAIVNLDTGARRFVPYPIQYLLADGKSMLSLNYRRLLKTIPDYGYDVVSSNFAPTLPLADDGVWHVNLETGEAKLILSLAQLAALKPLETMEGAQHYVNHCYPSPDGSRFLVIHRWVMPNGRMISRLLAVPSTGGTPKILLDEGKVSHYCWRNNEQFVVWARSVEHGDRYHLVNALTGDYVAFGQGVADVFGDGHPTFSHTNANQMLTDTYPDKKRQQHLMMYDNGTHQLVELGRFLSPWKYRNLYRCDLHPRFNVDGSLISIDSAHSGTRTSYVITRS